MENNYYTPDKEDLRIGYTCQFLNENRFIGPDKVWEDITLDSYDAFGIQETLKEGLIRTAYLTKEQIINQGWKEIPRELNGFGRFSYFKKGNDHITFQEKFHHIEIHNDEAYSDHMTYYDGECKSINEFKTLMKWLNIKE